MVGANPRASAPRLPPNKSLQRTSPPRGAIDSCSLLASIIELQRAGHRARPLSSRSLGGVASTSLTSSDAFGVLAASAAMAPEPAALSATAHGCHSRVTSMLTQPSRIGRFVSL